MYTIRSVYKTHVPELENTAYNQKPKSSEHSRAKLYQYDDTNIYQWYSHILGSVFEDSFNEPFVIEET